MKLNEVVSSNIKGVGYENGTLLVEYLGGSRYEYENVPEELFNEMLKADSKGKFVNASIKGKFNYKKVA